MSWKIIREVYRLDILKSGPRSMLAYLAFRGRDDGTSIYPTIDTIMRETGYSRRQAQTLLDFLVNEGYLIIVEQGGGRGKPTIYRIPVNEYGIITPKKAEIVEEIPAVVAPAASKPARQRGQARGFDVVPDLPRDDFLDDAFTPPAPAQQAERKREFVIPLSIEIDAAVRDLQRIWLQQMIESLDAEPGTSAYNWYRGTTTRMREKLNNVLLDRGYEPIHSELETQIAEWIAKLRYKYSLLNAEDDQACMLQREQEVDDAQETLNQLLTRTIRRRSRGEAI